MLVGLAVTMGLSLAEPGASLALAEASKNQELKSDYGRVTSLDSSKLSAKKEVISDPIQGKDVSKKQDRTIVREDESKRSANTSTFINVQWQVLAELAIYSEI